MPRLLQFTDLELDASQLRRSRRQLAPFPKGWSRLSFEYAMLETSKLVNWILLNVSGRFGLIQEYPRVVVYFEDHADATLFALLGGETACLEQQS